MTILIQALGASTGGGVRHLTGLLAELEPADPNREYLLMVRESFPELPTPMNVRVERVPDSSASRPLARILADTVFLPIQLRRRRLSAVVSLTNFGPIWSPVPHVLFQRNQIYFCPAYLQRIRGRTKADTLLRLRLATASMRRAAVIVTPSDAMAQAILHASPALHGRRFRTLYHGFAWSTQSEPLSEDVARKVDGARGLKLLYPSHAAPYKGFDVLFDALGHLKAAGVEFSLLSTVEWSDWPSEVVAYERQVRRLGLDAAVVFLGKVPQAQMGALYARCDLLVYPSLCESFGFPLLEAMHAGLPIVAADTAVNREICRDAATLYSALDAESAARAIVAATDSDRRAFLQEGARLRVESFDWSWRRYATEFVQLLDTVA